MSSSGSFGVGRRSVATTSPWPSRTMARHLVPPTSMPSRGPRDPTQSTPVGSRSARPGRTIRTTLLVSRCCRGPTALGPNLQLLDGVQDADLGPPLDEAGKRHDQLDGQV